MTAAPAVPVTWQAAANALATPFFDGVHPILRELDGDSWPTLTKLNELAAKYRVVNTGGMPIRFLPPLGETISAMRYETRIAESGEVPTRDNWHDLFNALQWIAFSNLKSAINAQHVGLLARGGNAEAAARSAPRDLLTMFDESGIIVASPDASLLELIRNFQWRELFVDRRREVIANMRFVLVGHGLMEKSLSPFIGITAKAMLLQIDTKVTAVDHAAANWLMDDAQLADSQGLAPLPLLGIPGWDERNVSPAFYENVDYFRPGRRHRGGHVR